MQIHLDDDGVAIADSEDRVFVAPTSIALKARFNDQEFLAARSRIIQLTRNDPIYTLSGEERMLFWKSRRYLMNFPDALPWFLQVSTLPLVSANTYHGFVWVIYAYTKLMVIFVVDPYPLLWVGLSAFSLMLQARHVFYVLSVSVSNACYEIMQSVSWDDVACVSEARKLMSRWERPSPVTALPLLDMKYPDPSVSMTWIHMCFAQALNWVDVSQ